MQYYSPHTCSCVGTSVHLMSIVNGQESWRHCARFQASAAVSVRPLFFWDVTQSRLVVSYRLFGSAYQTHLQGSSSPFFLNFQSNLSNTRGEQGSHWRNYWCFPEHIFSSRYQILEVHSLLGCDNPRQNG